MISIANISFSYGQKRILEDITFSAGSGEIVGILGNNGAGKSTLITCINRIREPSSGEVLINDQAISGMKGRDIARLIAYVPQRSEAEALSVFDCILLGRKPYIRWNIAEKDIDACRAVIHKLGLEHLQLRNMDELSGGEQQKVMIARALVQEPSVLLLDEPTSSLDPRNQIETMSLIRKAAKEDGITVLIVLHDLNLALRFCDRLFFMKDGRGIRYCRTDEVDGGAIRASYGVDADIATINGERFVMIRQEDIYGHE